MNATPGRGDPVAAREAQSRSAWGLVAQITVAVLLVWLLAQIFAGGSDELGSEISRLRTHMKHGEIKGFTWEGDLTSSTWYEVNVFELRESRPRRSILQSRRLYEESWLLTGEESSALTGKLEWRVEHVGPGGVIDSVTTRIDVAGR